MIAKPIITEVLKKFLKENGFTSLAALSTISGAMYLNVDFVWISILGFFIGRNWEIIVKLYKSTSIDEKVDEIIDKVEDKVDDIKEDIQDKVEDIKEDVKEEVEEIKEKVKAKTKRKPRTKKKK